MYSLYLLFYSPTPLKLIEWVLVGGWIILGTILFLVNKAGSEGTMSKEETEYLMFAMNTRNSKYCGKSE